MDHRQALPAPEKVTNSHVWNTVNYISVQEFTFHERLYSDFKHLVTRVFLSNSSNMESKCENGGQSSSYDGQNLLKFL